MRRLRDNLRSVSKALAILVTIILIIVVALVAYVWIMGDQRTLDHFTITGYPSLVTAGESFGSSYSVVVTAFDSTGHIKTDYVGTIYFISSDTQAILPFISTSKYTFTSGDNGTHEFDHAGFMLKTAGLQTITVTDGSISRASNVITVNTGSLSKFMVTASGGGNIGTQTAGTAYQITVTAVDAYDNAIASYTGNPSLTSSSWSGTKNLGAFSSGTKTGSFTSTIAGSTTIVATDTSITGTSNTFTVNPSTLDHFTVTASGSGSIDTQTAGTFFSITMTACDAYNNVKTDFTSTALLSDLSASIAPTTTTSFSSGAWTGSVTITETWTNNMITVTASSKTGTSNTFNVNPAAASVLVVSGFPSPVIAGTVGTVTVTAKDAYGNTATGYTGTVHFTSSDAQATLLADYLFVSRDNGVHTFTNGVALKTAGTQSITTTDTVTGSITGTQTGITVNPAALDHFSFSNISTQTVGTAFNVTITAADAYGNTVTSYTGRPDNNMLSCSVGYIIPPNIGMFSAGTKTASVTIYEAAGNNVYIIATDYDITGQSNSFTVNALG